MHPKKQQLIDHLSGPLPGVVAHRKMAVPGRELSFSHIDTAKKAAVLILLYHRLDRIFIALIKRKQHHADRHSGQISFPGGKMEADDDYPIQTALRESMEEIGTPADIDILGQLSPLFIPVSNFYVSPVIGWYDQEHLDFRLAEDEVDELLEIDIDLLFHTSAKTTTDIEVFSGMILKNVPAYQVLGHTIWGATAMVLSELEFLYTQPA